MHQEPAAGKHRTHPQAPPEGQNHRVRLNCWARPTCGLSPTHSEHTACSYASFLHLSQSAFTYCPTDTGVDLACLTTRNVNIYNMLSHIHHLILHLDLERKEDMLLCFSVILLHVNLVHHYDYRCLRKRTVFAYATSFHYDHSLVG